MTGKALGRRLRFASHIPALIAAMAVTKGPVLELGVGYGSTILLDALCAASGRRLISCDDNEKWLRRFSCYVGEHHEYRLVRDWDEVDMEGAEWGLVLVDHNPSDLRGKSAMRVRDCALLVLLHDSEPEHDWRYGYSEALPLFRHRRDYVRLWPNTTALSNFMELDGLWQ
jgi:hypothetical protein